jgi:hypothetical protein
MNGSTRDPLNSLRLPGRIPVDVAAVLVGFNRDDMPILASHKILRPLNAYGTNTVKMYAREDVLALAANREQLAKATRLVYEEHKAKNSAE